MDAVIIKLGNAGLKITKEKDGLMAEGSERLTSIDVETTPYPGFPTDMQAQFMALMSISEGTSFITENIFKFKGYKIIVLTHHTPYVYGTSHPSFDNSISNYAFSTDLSHLFPEVYIWAYGHTHYNNKGNVMKVDSTMLISNQLGIPSQCIEGYDNNIDIQV